MWISEFNSAIRTSQSAIEEGDVAQRESTCLARRGSAVQIRSSPPRRWRLAVKAAIKVSFSVRLPVLRLCINRSLTIEYG